MPVLIEPAQPTNLEDILDRMRALLRIFELLLGCAQSLHNLKLDVSTSDKPDYLDLHISMLPVRSDRNRDPHPSDILLNGGINPDKFSEVLKAWVNKEYTDTSGAWRRSRVRFNEFLGHQDSYTIDRLVGAANMFDTLPASAVGSMPVVAKELTDIAKATRIELKKLPQSDERNSLLGSLARIGKHNLKSKIKFRAEIMGMEVLQRLPDIQMVINEAVNCRNFFVHGTNTGKLSIEDKYNHLTFFIDTLEFIFGISDLIECGWEAEEWMAHASTDFPSSRYREQELRTFYMWDPPMPWWLFAPYFLGSRLFLCWSKHRTSKLPNDLWGPHYQNARRI